MYFNTNLYYRLQNRLLLSQYKHASGMAFSSSSDFLFMPLIDSWHGPQSGYLSFGNMKKSQGAKSGEYGGWEMTFVSCLAKNSVTIRLQSVTIQVFRFESGCDALHTQNMNQNVLSRSIRDDESLCYLFNANMTIFEHNFLHFFDVIVVKRGGWTTPMRQVFYDLATFIVSAKIFYACTKIFMKFQRDQTTLQRCIFEKIIENAIKKYHIFNFFLWK